MENTYIKQEDDAWCSRIGGTRRCIHQETGGVCLIEYYNSACWRQLDLSTNLLGLSFGTHIIGKLLVMQKL
jgi:hypothetical protein